MAAVQLLLPTISHPDCAIAQPVAVADEEVICEAVLHVAFFTMIPIQRLQRAFVHCGVMDDDMSPAVGFDRGGGDAFLYGGGQLRSGTGRWLGRGRGGDRESLADVDGFRATEVVPGRQRGNGYSMLARDVRQGVLGFDDVNGLTRGYRRGREQSKQKQEQSATRRLQAGSHKTETDGSQFSNF